MEMKGLPPYSGKEAPSDKRQPTVSANIALPQTSNTPSPTISTTKAADTTQFRQQNPALQQPIPALSPLLPPVNVLQFLSVSFDRLASMAASLFKANQRDTVDEEFAERWEQNEIDNPDLFDQRSKVKDTHQSNLGGNQ